MNNDFDYLAKSLNLNTIQLDNHEIADFIKINNLDPNKAFILGTIVTNNEINQKYKWLNENYPNIKRENIIFISNTMLKPDVILAYCKHYNINIKDVVFVDDRLDALRKAESLGITSYHPSSFME